ncbi:ABC transporter substrate-binding protein [Amycolatopsis orientalis]|uniref:ABC transporter substrate-binding protein n=1 Tax=Amycolatopsis orientalis TaxID=31958 RepID=UPI000407265B|nr:ABC transporter substrate-binding protein [Amycolatopsis orientalis]
MTRLLAGLTAAVLLLTACSGQAESGGPIKLTVATFGEFGYEKLFDEYEKAHPGITVEGRVADFETHHRQLATGLGAGRGAADVVAIEEQYLPKFRQSKDKFTDLSEFGAQSLRAGWPTWKWDQGTADGGKFVMGLGTDMGSLALCYRRDLFANAGLPTDREQVAALWPTWEKFAETGARFSTATPDVKFADSAGTIYTAMLNQGEENYFAKDGDKFVGDTNPNVRKAFELAGGMALKKETAAVTTFTQPWTVAIKQSRFAAITCPAWMLTQIEQAGGPELAGKWDVTSVPGGAGNWGGSFLTVPKQGPHRKEAYDLAAWLTAPEQQKRIFLESGLLPSAQGAYRDGAVLSHTSEYFSDAPVGKLFAASAEALRPNYRGLRDGEVRPVYGHALGRVEEGRQALDDAWAQAATEGRAAAGK